MRTIAIGLLAAVLAHAEASAQTADERARILRDFHLSVVDYTQQTCLAMDPGHAPPIFTPPVAMVFRQLIARALAERDTMGAISGVGEFPHPAVLEPFPPAELHDFPRTLHDALPPLPAPLEYRLVGHDLVLRDQAADLIVGVVRDAVGNRRIVVR
jgi:hypothetical protein